ncbi:hypothetical protein FRC08_009606 [Ceratobasidium sp. 394]|nr:hypothetical protein FRC08_009606 [Ceratobasidium sp. 394]
MAPSSRMNLASLLQSDPPDEPRRPPPSLPPLPPPPAPYPPESAPYPSQPSHSQPSHSQPHAQPLPPNYTSAPSQSYSGSSSQYYSQPPAQSQHLPPPQPAAHYHQPQSHSYTPSPTHTGPPPPPPAHSHQYHQHSHQHAHHPLHTHLPSHSHSHHPHPHHHPHAHAHHHPHSHHPIAGHAHSHLHVVHAHPPAAPTPPAPASSSSTAGSPPAFASHAFNQPPGARGPQPIIPLNSTPAPRSPVHYTGASRSPTAPYPIYGAGSLTGRRSPEFAPSGQPPMAGSSSGPRRNTLTSANVSSGPQAIEPVTLRDYPPYPNSGSTKHADEGSYPPAFSAPVYGSRPQSPQTQTGNKARRSGGTSASIASRGTGAKRSVGGSSDLKRPNERSEKDEREMDKEREEHAHRERERERERDREREREQQERSRERREYEERAVRERERERQILEIDFRDGRRPSAIKRPLESEFARRPASTSEWDRPRERGENGTIVSGGCLVNKSGIGGAKRTRRGRVCRRWSRVNICRRSRRMERTWRNSRIICPCHNSLDRILMAIIPTRTRALHHLCSHTLPSRHSLLPSGSAPMSIQTSPSQSDSRPHSLGTISRPKATSHTNTRSSSPRASSQSNPPRARRVQTSCSGAARTRGTPTTRTCSSPRYIRTRQRGRTFAMRADRNRMLKLSSASGLAGQTAGETRRGPRVGRGRVCPGVGSCIAVRGEIRMMVAGWRLSRLCG